MIKTGIVYILSNKSNTVLYTGVTSNLEQRLYQHRIGFFKNSFTSKYKTNKLVYFEEFFDINDAIAREKQIKAGSRKRKNALIESINPEWNELWAK